MSHKSFIHRLKDGQHYMDLWPVRKELAPIFPEQRIIKATRFGIKVMPAIAASCVNANESTKLWCDASSYCYRSICD